MNSTSKMDDDDAPIIVFLIGGPGSGKTTQAEALAGDDDSESVRVYVVSFFLHFFLQFYNLKCSHISLLILDITCRLKC